MARRRNGIWYEGCQINNRENTKLSKSKQGNFVLDILVAEQFSQKNSSAPQEFQDATRAADDYVNTYTAWHKVRIFADAGDQSFIELVTNPLFNHGCVVEIDAQYEETKPWEDRGGRIHAGRQERIFWGKEDSGSITIKELPDGRVLGSRDEWAKPLYNGNFDALPALGGTGGGGPAAPEYKDDEGF